MYARCQRRSIRTDTLSSGRPTGAQRQMEMQQKLQEMQAQMAATQESGEIVGFTVKGEVVL